MEAPFHPPLPSSSSWWFLIHTKLYRYRALLRKYWWIVLGCTVVGLCVAAWKVSQLTVVYSSTGRIIVSGKIALPESAGYSEEMANYVGTQMQLMQSEEVRKRAQARVQAIEPGTTPESVVLEVSTLPQTAIFVLKTTGPTPKYTQKILDAIMVEYIAMKREMRSEKSEATQEAITDQLARMEREVHDGEQELLEFQKQNNVGFLQEEGNSAGAYLVKLNHQLAELKTEYQLLELLDIDQNIDRRNLANGESSGTTPGAMEDSYGRRFGPEGEYLKARQEIELLKAQRADFGRDLREKHPIMVDLDQQIQQKETLIKSFRQQSVEQIKSRHDSIRLQMQNLETAIKEWETKALDLSQRLAEYNSIKNKLDRKKAAWDRLLTALNSVEVNRNVDQDIVSIMEKAKPAVPTTPGVLKTILTGLVGGLVVGLVILFLVDQLDDRVASFVEFQSRFREAVLSQIPRDRFPDRPLTFNDDRHAFVEALRSLRSSLLFMPFEGEPPRAFLVTSAVPNEGKSTIASNFAITMSHADARVLLIDGDLRRGALHEKFNLLNKIGFSEVLRGESNLRDAIQATDIPNLFLLPCGKSVSNPGELYLAKSTDALLKEIYAAYDYIVIDSSPVMAADDTTSLAPKIDATLFVFRFTFSSSRTSRKAIDLLRARQANVIGVICNDVDEAMQEYSYYRYPQYYGPKAEPKNA